MTASVTTGERTSRGLRQRSRGEAHFAGLARAAALSIVVLLVSVAFFLLIEGAPALTAPPSAFGGKANFFAWVWPLLYGTVFAASIAILIATPLALGVALAITHYVPRRLASLAGALVEVLASVPSVIYGLWGVAILGPALQPSFAWLAEHLGWLPFFAGPVSATGRTILTAGIVLAIMILPFITAISRDVFARTPVLHQEAALALGATRWEMIRLTVLPHSRSGVFAAVMLGLGRALGETMAVALVLSPAALVTLKVISSDNPSTIAATIALNFPEATGADVNALVGAGLVLFAVSFGVNYLARWIVRRGREVT